MFLKFFILEHEAISLQFILGYMFYSSSAGIGGVSPHSLGLLKVLMAESRVRCVEEGKLESLVCHPGVHVASQGQPVVISSLSVTLS